jgi:non-ribosomal peptide synthetase component F
VEALKPGTNASQPFFQTRFEFSNFPSRERLEIKGLKLSPLGFETGLVRFDLNLIMEERGNRLGGWLQYVTAIYTDNFIIRLAQNYEILLQRIIRQPELRLSELSLDLLLD